MNDSGTKIIVFPLKGTRLLRETADSRIGTNNEHGKSRISCRSRKQERYQRTRVVSNGLKEADETAWALIIIITTKDWNTSNKLTWTHNDPGI